MTQLSLTQHTKTIAIPPLMGLAKGKTNLIELIT